jgi:hypothetical protein
MSSRVPAEIDGWSRSASETVFFEKPTSSAIICMVTGRMTGHAHYTGFSVTVK